MKVLVVSFLVFVLCACNTQHKWTKVSKGQFNKRALEISGDFDGDSNKDNAYLANKDNVLALAVELSSKGLSNQYIVGAFNNVNLENVGLELITKNSLVFICTKDCEHKEQKKLLQDSIVFFEIESSRSLYIYNYQKDIFEEFWLSD